ncbi:Transcription-repair-coupling factor [Candidatus Magnetomoraceae bacterium gMMP-15]
MELYDLIDQNLQALDCTGLLSSEQAFLLSRIYKNFSRSLILITPTKKQGEIFLDDFRFFMGDHCPPLFFFSSYNIMPFKFMPYHNETAAQRINILYQMIICEKPPVIITTVEALLQKMVPKKEISSFVELLMEEEEIDREDLIEKLIAGGYNHSIIVEEAGDFCARGSIIDIFSPFYPDPIRMEFYGNTIDSLRFFSAATQRSIKRIQEAVVIPAKEAILYKKNINKFIQRVKTQAQFLEISDSKIQKFIERFQEEKNFSGVESLISLVYPKLDSFFNYSPKNALWFLLEPLEMEKEALEIEDRIIRNYETARNEKRLCVLPEDLYLKWSEIQEYFKQKQCINLKASPVLSETRKVISFSVNDNIEIKNSLRNQTSKEELLLPLAKWIQENINQKYLCLLVCRTTSQANRLDTILKPYGISIRLTQPIPDINKCNGMAYICLGQISSGFVWPAEHIAIITEDEIFGPKQRTRKIPEKRKPSQLVSFADLKQGDLIVHIEHGIGQYQGLVKFEYNKISNDFLLITYRDNDKLYVPVDNINMIQKYMGIDKIMPVLDKMGGKTWEKIRNKVKKSVEKIAKELLKLYASRKVKKGFAFSQSDSYFQDFEASFEYDETHDQLKAINDVLYDMEQAVPMDRLICGDVGYGKTEVALRASFKAVNDGKQVAVLVPTTILCEQHYRTFIKRFEKYPVIIESLNRFRTPKEQRSIVSNLASGKLDIIIGTHRLLQKDIKFKDLGLLIIDEEQRFGVKHKEKLKKFRSTVDVLAMTATPIPRTLHMSLTGIRDISIMSTPPEQRRPITTFISKFDGIVIAEAIKKELSRNGQIFFLHNTVKTIEVMAAYLQKLVPELRIGIAHGQLGENKLEKIMLQFINHDIDMLICTTIVESGLDIPAANTILINRADRFGLAQIYQLRGRVGRTDEQAYAYLFIPDESALGKDAQKRIKVLMEHSDLGDGFRIAMSDLQIRGGGSILSSTQSGRIASIGYEMYLELMERTMEELKGESTLPPLQPEINLNRSVFIPESYISDIDQRLSTYRRLSGIDNFEELGDFKQEITDRFGKLPKEASNLLSNIALKILSKQAGVSRLDLAGRKLSLSFSQDHQRNPQALVKIIMENPKQFQMTPENVLITILAQNKGLMVQIKNILKKIAQCVNNS